MYIDALLEEAVTTPGVNVVSFRMRREDGYFPPPGCTWLGQGGVGISFSFHRELFNAGFRMGDGDVEDFQFINALQSTATVRPDVPRITVMSPLCTYFVRMEPVMDRDNMTLADLSVPGARRVNLSGP
jgi:hypothetical protein